MRKRSLLDALRNNNNNNIESRSPVEGAVLIWEVPNSYLGTRHIQTENVRASP